MTQELKGLEITLLGVQLKGLGLSYRDVILKIA